VLCTWILFNIVEMAVRNDKKAGGLQLFVQFLCFNKHAALVLLVLTLGYFTSQYDRYIYSVSKVPFINYSSYEYGLLAGPVFSVVYTVSAIAMSSTFRKMRVKGMTLVMAFWSSVIMLVALSDSFWQVALLRAGLAVGESGYTPLATSLLGDYFPARVRGAAMGVFIVGLYAGYGASLAAGDALDQAVGWRWSYVVAGLLPAAVLAAILCVVREPSSRGGRGGKKAERDHPENVPPALREDGDMRGKTMYTLKYWSEHKSLLWLGLAAGTRNLAGLVFGNFIASFFSPMYQDMPDIDERSPCKYSYSEDYIGTQICDSGYPYCVDSKCVALSTTPWHDVGMSADRFEFYMLVLPLVGGSLGAILGGALSDRYSKTHGPGARLLVMAGGAALAAPFAFGLLLAPYPWCFVCMLGAYLFGETWSGVALAAVVDLVPGALSAVSLALLLAAKALLGGAGPMAVPYLAQLYSQDHTYSFNASNTPDATDAAPGVQTTVSVTQASSEGLQSALLWLYAGGMVLSVAVFYRGYQVLAQELQSGRHTPHFQAVMRQEGEEEEAETLKGADGREPDVLLIRQHLGGRGENEERPLL